MTAADKERELVVKCLIELDLAVTLGVPISAIASDERDQGVEALSPTTPVDGPAPGGREQPGCRPVRHAVDFPPTAGLSEGFLNCVLRSAEVAEVPDENRDESRPLLVEDFSDARCGVWMDAQSNSITGRTSTRPNVAFGILAAQSSASSRLATSMT